VRPLALTPGDIADFVERTLVDGTGGWSLGVQGALAEFALRPGERATVRRRGRTVEATGGGGALRLTITDDTTAFGTGRGGADVTLAVPRAALPAPRPGLTLGRSDPDALRPADGSAVLADLAAGHRLVAASPHRVVIGPLGRIEVWNPIPPASDASPAGCHTHLLPALLETGREVAGGDELPPQLVAAGNWTNPGWGSRFTLVKSPPT